MTYKTKHSDVSYFEARVKHWAQKLSLGDWKIEVFPGDTGESSAECEMWHDAHGAQIRIKQEFGYKPEKPWLDKLALHEVAHVLLCDLTRLIKNRSVTDEQIETSQHAVIRRLENLLC